WFTQPALASTLKKVATLGSSHIYHGDFAIDFVRAVQNDGGKISAADMEQYAVIWSEPVRTTFRGYEVVSPGLPSNGGVDTVEALNVLEAAGFPGRGDYANDAESLFWFMQIHRFEILSFLPIAEKTQ